MFRFLIPAVLLLALPLGCAIPYQPLPPSNCSGWGGSCGGVQTTNLGKDTFGIYVLVHNGRRELALEYFHRRREELATELGYDRCETLAVAALNNPKVLLEGAVGAQADGQVKCFRVPLGE